MSRSLTNYSRDDFIRFVTVAFAVVWAPQVYGAVANHPVLGWLYVPMLAPACFPLSLFALCYMAALIAGDLLFGGLLVGQAGLAVQTALIIWLWRRGRLVRPISPDSRFARLHQWAMNTARPILTASAVVLLLGVICFRSVPPVEAALWALCCGVMAWAIPLPRTIQWRTAAATTILALAATAFALAIVEVGARIALPPVVRPLDIYMPDTEYIFTLRPNSKGDFTLLDNDKKQIAVEAVISSQGVRDRIIGPKAKDEFRIVMLGDSYTMGHGLKPEHNVPEVLQRVLNDAGLPKRVTVVNCGVGGYSPWQERGFLRARGFGFDPDLVILQLFPANDVGGSLSRVEKYLRSTEMSWEKRLNMFRRLNLFPAQFQRWFEQHSRAYWAIAMATKEPDLAMGISGNLRWVEPVVIPRPANQENRNPYREASLIEWYPELEEAYGMFERDIQGMRDDCRERGVDCVAFCHPFPMGILEDGWREDDLEAIGVTFELDKDVRVTEKIFDRAGIPHANVTSALESHPNPEALYFKYDGHWTPQGAEVVAQSIADFLLRDYFPAKVAAPAVRQ